ncbi:MAG: flippase-like domain-containing protein [Bacteroidales bacterium]|nr:flippase-like domain-containing protein [Bacteroidales bacterium]
MAKKIKLNKYLKFSIKLVLSVAALIFVFSRINLTDVLKLYGHLKFGWLLPALLFFIFSKIISAIRLNNFFRCIDLLLSELYNLKLYLLGMFYNIFLPGGIGGDGYKIYLLNKQHEVKTGKIIWATLVDRITGAVTVIYLLVILSYFITFRLDFPIGKVAWIILPMGIAGYYFFLKIFFKYFIPVFLGVNLLALGVQILQAASAYFILQALGYNDQVIPYLFLFLISSIIAGLPITIGGIGSRELTFLIGADIMGLNVEVSIAMSLMFYLITLFVSLFGMYFSLFPGRLKTA